MSLGEAVRQRRKDLDLTQADVYKRLLVRGCEVDPSYVGAVENNRIALPSDDILQALAKALETTSIDLLHAAGYIPDEEIAEMHRQVKRRINNDEMARVFNQLPQELQETFIGMAELYLKARERNPA